MQRFFSIDRYGKKNIVSHYDHCEACKKLAALSSYVTHKFVAFRQFPLVPLGKKIRVMDECSQCGHSTTISERNYRKKRTKDLAAMMSAFNSESDNPYAALNGMQTLLVYDEESWFMDLKHSYGSRFENHMLVQLLIAQGLCRFGHYREGMEYARKAVVLGAGSYAEEVLSFCQSRLEAKEAGLVAPPGVKPESMLRPYAFIAVVLIGSFLAIATNGISAMYNYRAWLVNGSHVPYTIEIDGHRYQLGPYEHKQIKLRLGVHKMQVHGLAGHEIPVSFDYETSLLKQKIENHAFVLNPDAIAVMAEETLLEGQVTNRYSFGKVINVLEGIDHPFSGFPIWAGSRHASQTRLFLHSPSNHLEMVEFLRAHGDVGDATKYAGRLLTIDPSVEDMETLLEIATSELTVEQAVGFLETGKRILPPLIAWHCFYQDFMGVRQPGHDLQTEYGLLCKQHPDTLEFYYLLGRVARNRDISRKLFEKSEKPPGCGGAGFFAIAYDLLCAGEFKEAQPYSQRALEQAPDQPEYKALDRQIHLALRQYDQPLAQVSARLEMEPENGEWVAEKIKYLTLLGDHHAASEAIKNFPGSDETWTHYFSAVRFYVSGNVKGYLNSLMASGRESAELKKLLHSGNIEAAYSIMAGDEGCEYTDHLILYCAAKYHGYPKIGEIELTRAIEKMGESTPVQKEVATILSGDTPPSASQILDLRLMPKEKAVLCASLGFKFPVHQESFFSLSKKLNYAPEYPHLLLKKWVRQPVAVQKHSSTSP